MTTRKRKPTPRPKPQPKVEPPKTDWSGYIFAGIVAVAIGWITLYKPAPKPVDPVDPNPSPVQPVDSEVAKACHDAMVAYSKAVATDYRALAAKAKSGEIKTVIEAGNVATKQDVVSRTAFKQAMAKIMQPKLGNADLPADASTTFDEMAKGFEGVK